MNQNYNKTHCIRKHEFTEENTYVFPNGKRACKTCRLLWYKKHRDGNKEKRAISKKKWDNNNKTHTREYQRTIERKRVGWTKGLWDSTLKEQKRRCAICKQYLELEGKGKRSATADHIHVNPPIPRGILCSHCNMGLGLFKDNPAILIEAAKYVERHKP